MPSVNKCCCICSGFLRVYIKYMANKINASYPDWTFSQIMLITNYWYDSNMVLLFTDNITNANDHNNPPTKKNFAEDILGIEYRDYTPPYPQPVGTQITIPWVTPAAWPWLTNRGLSSKYYNCGYVRLPPPGTSSVMECLENTSETPAPRPDGSIPPDNLYAHFYTDYIPIKYQWA